MTREEFDSLIRKLEAVSRRHPRLYLARIIGLVALAYGYLLLILVGSLALAVAMIVMVIYVPATIKLALIGLIAFGGIFWAVARGLWVRLEPPTGPEITRAQAPKLFALLDELRAALQCRPFHKVLLIGEMNAAVVQIPRLGVFGWHTNYLLIGLPLMQSLAPEEFKAVLAHEFAHSSGGHGSFGNWLYRVRRTWQQVFEQMIRQRTRFGGVLFKFINWFWPVFNGHAFVLARANEYEADACSVRLAGADVAANALMRLPITGTLLGEKFWPDILSRANQDKEPPADVMLSLNRVLKNGLETTEAQKRLRQSFLLETNNADTHPCLKDRLRAMNRLPEGVDAKDFTVTPPPLPHESAAEIFLGTHAEVVARQLSDVWRKAIAANWAKRHEQAQKLAGELASLEAPAADVPLTPGQLWQKALKLIQLHSDKEAMPVIEHILALEPGHAAANFVLGRHRLEADDASGVALIEAAMAADYELTQQGCNLLYGYYRRNGQSDQLKPLEQRVDKFSEITALARQERNQVNAANTFTPHELTREQVDSLRQVVAAEPEIGSVVIARKQVQHFKSNPCFVIGLTLKVPAWKPRGSTANAKVLNRVLKQLQLPGQFLVFINGKNLKGLWTKIADVPGAAVYVRPPG
ncbi:MAG: M48 family metallopeptidase [Verrucomicrobiae bacterium]|nr:M48 family metallopeptidase [Verrucomicrobiae bacterium]